jgi:ribosomal protein L34E
MSAKRGGVLCKAWLDFEAFVAAVGQKPGAGWRIYRKDTRKPYEPGNVQWRELVHTVGKYKTSEELREARNEARKSAARRDHDPAKYRARMLKTNYGVTVAQYEQMLAEQNGVCAICKKPETRMATRGEGLRPLSVDHCHDSEKVRGLLCSHCNTALGLLNDDIALFEKAIEYLKRNGNK